MQVDAAVNLHLGQGWVSTAWQSQSQFEFWAANNPLYTFLVYCWISLVGIHPAAVRGLNFILVLLIAAIIVDACRRIGLVQTFWGRWLLAALLVADGAVAYVFRSGRADLATMLVLAILFWVYETIEDQRLRRRLLFVAALPLLISGLQAIPCVAALLLLEYVIRRKLRIADYIAIVSGCAVGTLAWFLFLVEKHALKAYVAQTFASDYNIAGSTLQLLVFRDRPAVERFMAKIVALSPIRVAQTIASDGTLLPLILYFSVVVVVVWLGGGDTSKLRRWALTGLIAACLIPYAMLAAGRYPLYYAWMGAAPVVIAFVALLERCMRERRHTLWITGLVAGVFAVFLGLPRQVWTQMRTIQPDAYAVVQRQLRAETHVGDSLFGDPVFYYAAKLQGIPFRPTSYSGGRGYRTMSDAERAEISLVLVKPEDVDDAFRKVGGQWKQSGTLQSPYGYQIAVFRRAN